MISLRNLTVAVNFKTLTTFRSTGLYPKFMFPLQYSILSQFNPVRIYLQPLFERQIFHPAKTLLHYLDPLLVPLTYFHTFFSDIISSPLLSSPKIKHHISDLLDT